MHGSLRIHCLVATICLASLAGGAAAQAAGDRFQNGPYSSGILTGHAIATGQLKPVAGGLAVQGAIAPALACGPAPCALPNVQASPGGQPANEDPIAVNPRNPRQLLSAGNDYTCSSLQGYYASADSGSTWTHNCGVAQAGLFGDGDPVVAYDLAGVAYRGGLNVNSQASPTTGVVAFSKSTDNGTTWSAPITAVPSLLGGLADKPWMEIDTTRTSPRRNAIYISATQFSVSGNSTQISVSHSTDGGTTWKTARVGGAQTYPNVVQFSDLAIAADGTVYLSWMYCTSGATLCANTSARILLSHSTDGGTTWSRPSTIGRATLAPNAGCGGFYGCVPNTRERVSNIPVIAIDNSSAATAGRLYLANYTWTGTQMKVQVAASSNGGGSWGRPVAVAPASVTQDQFFPWINVSASGRVGVTWLDRRLDARNISYDAFGAASSNGGATFPNVRLSTQSSNPGNDGFSGTFMGDYTGNAWAGNTLFMSWMDTRNGSNAQTFVGGLRAQ